MPSKIYGKIILLMRQRANKKGAYWTVWMRRLIYAFDARIEICQVFSRRDLNLAAPSFSFLSVYLKHD